MRSQDYRNLEHSGSHPEAAERYEAALAQLQCYRGDPLATIDGALALAPDFAMAHALRGYLGVLGTEASGFEMARAAASTLDGLRVLPREAGHRAALHQLGAGNWREGMAELERVLADHPLDVLALQAQHLSSFFVGDARMLRDGVASVVDVWQPSMPGYHAVLGMHAFGLEEMGEYARAEQLGRAAIEHNPYDVWAQHAVAHVYEMQGRVDAGIDWMLSREPYWAVDNSFAVHNVWHLGLYLLAQGKTDEVLALYDRRIRGTHSQVVLELIDASAMLWRLHLRRIDTGDRFVELAAAYAPSVRDGVYAFNDVHAAIAFVGAGRSDELAAVHDSLRAQIDGAGDTARMARDVGLPVVEALIAFARGDYRRTVEILRRVIPIANRFGGSHAQRDLLDQTLAEAARRAGDENLVNALARVRQQRRA